MPPAAGAGRAAGGDEAGARLRAVLAVGAVAAAALAIYGPTLAAMAAIWARSDTFAHGFLVLPVCLWLLWRTRGALAATRPRPSWPALALLAGLVALWVVASAVRAGVVAQASVMLMAPVAVLVVLGPDVLRAAGFPLFFALLAVPFGEFLMPALMDVTATGSVLLLLLTGVPVYRDGWLISIPEGNFQVAEACSGVRYLIAAVSTAILFGWFFFETVRKRILFICFTVVLTILANVLRAYIIILLARLTDMRLAVGVDHFIYGWVLFSVLLAVVLVIGLRYADRAPAAAFAAQTHAWPPRADSLVAAGVTAAVLLAGPLALARVEPDRSAAGRGPGAPAEIAGAAYAGPASRPGWLRDGIAPGARHLAYRGAEAAFVLHVFPPGADGEEAGPLRPYLADDGVALVADEGAATAGGHAFRQMRLEAGGESILVGYWFAVGPRQTANPVTAKIMELLTIMQGEHIRPALLAVALETTKLDQPANALQQIVAEAVAAASCIDPDGRQPGTEPGTRCLEAPPPGDQQG